MSGSKGKKKKPALGPVEECVRRVATPKERAYFREFLEALVKNNAVPEDLLRSLPVPAKEAGKTRFDQLYDAATYLAFPGYRVETLQKLLGPSWKPGTETRIWRVLLPPRFKLSHVLIRAPDMSTAFALGSDYACRLSLRMFRTIPADLTVRVQFVSEKAIRRTLFLRWANRVKRRKQLQLVGREYTSREIAGARLIALGPPGPSQRVAKYMEHTDLIRVLHRAGLVRASSVEAEIFRKPPEE